MPEISLDFGSVPDFEPIPAGQYLVEVVEVDGPKLSNAGNSMLQLTFEIVEGPFTGRKVYNHFLLLEGDAFWRTKRDLRILMGLDKEQKDVTFSTEDLVGTQAIASIFPEVYKEEDGGDGEARPKVRKLKEASSTNLF